MSPLQIVQAATRAINEGRINDALHYYADDVRQYSPGRNGDPQFQVRKGKDLLRRVLEADVNGPRQARYLHDHYVTDGSTVAVRGRNSGVLGGTQVEQPIAAFYEFEDDRISSVTVYYDRLAFQTLASKGSGSA